MDDYMNRSLNPDTPHPYAIAEVSTIRDGILEALRLCMFDHLDCRRSVQMSSFARWSRNRLRISRQTSRFCSKTSFLIDQPGIFLS